MGKNGPMAMARWEPDGFEVPRLGTPGEAQAPGERPRGFSSTIRIQSRENSIDVGKHTSRLHEMAIEV